MIKIIAIAYCIYKVVANPKPVALVLVLLSFWLMVSSTTEEVVKVSEFKRGDVEVVEVEKIEKITRCNHTQKLQEFRVGTIFKRIIDILNLQEKTEQKEIVIIQQQGFKEAFLVWLMCDYENYKSWRDGVVFTGKIMVSAMVLTIVFVGVVATVTMIKKGRILN